MKQKNIAHSKGIALAIISTVLGSLATITYKPLMAQGIAPATLALIEAFSIVVFLLFLAKPWHIVNCQPRTRNPALLASAFQAIATTSFFLGLNNLEPVTFGFISRNQAVFSIILGFYFLAERHTISTWIFIALSLCGALVLCYADVGVMSPVGVLFAFLYCFCFSIRNFIVRKYPHTPVIISIFYGYLLSFIVLLACQCADVFGAFIYPEPLVLLRVVSVALLAALGSIYFFQLALRHEAMSLVTSIRLFSPFIVTLYFGWQINFAFSPLKISGMVIMTAAIFTLVYSYKERESARVIAAQSLTANN